MSTSQLGSAGRGRRLLVLGGAAAVFLAILALPLPEGLGPGGHRALAVFALCVILWATDVIPIAVTGLLAMLLLPVTGAMSREEAFSLFGNPAVFFILGAFLLAGALMASGLSVRLALRLLHAFDGSPRRLTAGIMVSAGLLSFVMPEHAVAAMLFPAVLEIARALELPRGESAYGKQLFLALAWGAVIGGIGTLLGGARNILAVTLLAELAGRQIGFLEWMVTVAPLSAVMMATGYLVLLRSFPVEVKDVAPARRAVAARIASMGPMSRREKGVLAVMVLVVVAWIAPQPWLGLAETAMAGAALLFVFSLVTWSEVQSKVNWGVILMYGGAVALGRALQETGVTDWFAARALPPGLSPLATVGIMAAVSILLTEVISNVAAVAILLPAALSLAPAAGIDPRLATYAVAVPAGLAFCLPMGTPPNAICFASGYYQIRDSVRGGAWLNVLAWLLIMGACATYWRLLGLCGG